MKTTGDRRIKIGIVGCGAIGSRLAKAICRDLKKQAQLTALYDVNQEKAGQLAEKLKDKRLCKHSLEDLLRSSQLIIEAVNAPTTREIIGKALNVKKDVLAMSVGKLLPAQDLFTRAQKNRCFLLIPSGALAGIDAIKAASQGKIEQINLTTRKPLLSFVNIPYLKEKGIDLSRIDKETVIFEGNVKTAVEFFPQNINIAATIALASQAVDKMFVRIITSPEYSQNSHEVEVTGDFGRIQSRTDNCVCADNPKTSYLAVLSAIQTLKQFFTYFKIGT